MNTSRRPPVAELHHNPLRCKFLAASVFMLTTLAGCTDRSEDTTEDSSPDSDSSEPDTTDMDTSDTDSTDADTTDVDTSGVGEIGAVCHLSEGLWPSMRIGSTTLEVVASSTADMTARSCGAYYAWRTCPGVEGVHALVTATPGAQQNQDGSFEWVPDGEETTETVRFVHFFDSSTGENLASVRSYPVATDGYCGYYMTGPAAYAACANTLIDDMLVAYPSCGTEGGTDCSLCTCLVSDYVQYATPEYRESCE